MLDLVMFVLDVTPFDSFVTPQSLMYALRTLLRQIFQRFEFKYFNNKHFSKFISKHVLKFIALYEFLCHDLQNIFCHNVCRSVHTPICF